MSAAPIWDGSGQGDLLELIALGTPQGTADREWDTFVWSLQAVAETHDDGVIRPNELRPLVRDHVAPRRIGAFTNRALSQGLVEYTGDWQVSDDHAGRNGGKPARVMRWLGRAT